MQLNHYTRKNIVCQQLTREEIQLLLEAYTLLRGNWALMSKYYFPNRSMNQLKCKYAYERSKAQEKREEAAEVVKMELIVFDGF